jgi:hypothetical protein
MKILEFLNVADGQFSEIYGESISYFENKATNN